MQSFKNGEIDVLVATSVVEVGVDIPNASIMMIEGSDRFGLSQLHQFRGRVGRGKHQSYCFLFTDSKNPDTQFRLNSFANTTDGFEIADLDLQLRGPGNIYSTIQSGHLEYLKLASISDTELASKAKNAALSILKSDPSLSQYTELNHEISKQSISLHFE